MTSKEQFDFGTYRANIGQQIREAREKANMTQDELAAKSGLQRSHIARIESGKYNVSLDTVALIADALGANLSVGDKRKAISRNIISKAKAIAAESNGYYMFIPSAEFAKSLIESTESEYKEYNEEMPEIWVKRIELLRDLLEDFSPAIIDMESPCIESTLSADGFWFDGKHYTAD